MAWSSSGLHAFWWGTPMSNTPSSNSLLNLMRVTLWDDTRTPNRAATANSYYGAGQWPLTAEVASAPGWPAGMPMPGFDADTFEDQLRMFGGSPTVSLDRTSMEAFGSMIYDSQGQMLGNADPAFCFHYFGGPVESDDGTFVIMWPPEGAAIMTCHLWPFIPVP